MNGLVLLMGRWVLFGGNANNEANTGLGYLNTNNSWSDTDTNVGSRNSSIKIFKIGVPTLPLGKKSQLWSILLGLSIATNGI